MELSFLADKWRVSGPRVDGSFVVSFETGEYQKVKVAELMANLEQDQELNITVRTEK